MSTTIIYTASTGAGHTLAAISLKEAMESNGMNAVILDAFKESGQVANTIISQGYKQLVENLPKVYKKLYQHFDADRVGNEVVMKNAARVIKGDLLKDFERIKPDLIISTHPIVTNTLGRLKEEGYFNLPVLSFVTDYKVHEVYIKDSIDAYVVASDFTKESMIDREVDPNKIYAYGIPTRSEFNTGKRPDELNSNQGSILLMAGSLGSRQLKKAFLALLHTKANLSITVVCGKNERVRQQLELLAAEIPHANKEVKVLGYVNNISELMDQSDAIITKPGGLTTSEAIMKNIPMIIPYAYPGQEEDNAHYLVQNGMALQTDNINNLTSLVDFLIENRYIINHMSQAMSEEAQKHSIQKTVELCQNLIKEYQDKTKEA